MRANGTMANRRGYTRVPVLKARILDILLACSGQSYKSCSIPQTRTSTVCVPRRFLLTWGLGQFPPL